MRSSGVWEGVLALIEQRVPRQVFDTWFMPVQFIEIKEEVASFEVPNKFFGAWLKEHYGSLVAEALTAVNGEKINDLTFIPRKSGGGEYGKNIVTYGKGTSPSPTGIKNKKGGYLNTKYTFENFVVGASNQFAHAACLRVGEAPGQAYNPLFIYGGVGLGKTHLLNAIGNYLGGEKDFRIAYVTTEQFTNEVINSIRYDKMVELRRRYRSIDMLLIDDIQFLAGKERTQEEFFHTFNTLYEGRKQIVLSSDRSPKEIANTEERLQSRFGWGLIADLQPPDVETRIAILRKKSEDERIPIPEDIIQYLAEHLKTNVRELEGSLVRIGAYSSLTGQPLTLETAKNVLRDIISDTKKVVTMDDIQEAVSARFQVRIGELKSRRRSKNIVHPRQIAMYLCRELTSASFPEIGRHFGGKDHTTIIHACRQITKAIDRDNTVKTAVENLKGQIARG